MRNWLSVEDFARRAGIAPRNARAACQRGVYRGAELSTRQVHGRGRGGRVWQVEASSLPIELQAGETETTPKLRDTSATEAAAAWERFERAPDSMRERAEAKLAILRQVEVLTRSGFNKTEAVNEVAQRSGQSAGSIYRWEKSVKGWKRDDHLAALLDHHTGRVAKADFSPEAWAMIREDYLRVEQPALTACVERAQRHSRKHGLEWEIPSIKTIKRRIDSEIPAQVRVLAREGTEALERLFPAQERDHGYYEALQAVNADGHKFDVFVRLEDGTVVRPVLAAFQDIRSGKFLGYRLGETENADLIRLAFGDLVEQWGIPDMAYLDNGRGFASKWMTGGTRTRFRFKVKADEPSGIFRQMGVETKWVTPYHGQAKPIERAFRDLCEYVAKHPACAGAYTGNKPTAKPENYGTKAVPIALFRQILDEEIAAHNARQGRRGGLCNGRSFDEVFNDSYQQRLQRGDVRMPAEHQRRLWLLTAEAVKAQHGNGEVKLAGNRYWTEALVEYQGKPVVVRFDPEKLHETVWVYTLDGRFIGSADCIAAVGFGDTEAAREHARQKKTYRRAAKQMLRAEKRMDVLAGTLPTEADAEREVAEIVPLSDPNESEEPFDAEEAFAAAAAGMNDNF